MSRLFAGTPWDRPPSCDRCGKPETECACPPPAESPPPPPEQCGIARLCLEKRKKGKLVSVISGLALADLQRETLTATLKTRCGTGGTSRDDQIELQGDQIDRVEEILKALGYRTKRP